MSGIFQIFGGGSQPTNPQKSAAPRVQTSIEGRPKAIGAGQNRLAGNIIWYGDFAAQAVTSAPASGGKGGAGSGSTGKGSSGTLSYKYSASFMVSVGEQISAVQMIQNGNQYDFNYTPSADLTALLNAKGVKITSGNTYGATYLLGTFSQTGWAYLTSAHPTQSLNYRGEAVACFPNLALGSSASLPNFNFEILWKINTDVAAYGPDANPADWATSFLSDTDWGVGFPRALLAGLNLFNEADVYATVDLFGYFGDARTWARAAGLLISPVITGQTAANSHLLTLSDAISAGFVWNDGFLDLVPIADAAVTGNGYTYSPNITPLYDLTDNDLQDVQHGPGVGPGPTAIKISRSDPTQVDNVISVAYLDRANLYNPVTIYNSDPALIQAAGRKRFASIAQYDFFCTKTAASKSASLLMHRSKAKLRTFFFTLPPQFALLKPLDIVTLTNTHMNLVRQPVRIMEIVRQADGRREITAEEFLGAAHPPVYSRQGALGAGYNANQAPGSVTTPIIFEPTADLTGGLEVWMGATGADLTIWGGCNVWMATDAGGTYQQIGVLHSPSRMGVTTAILPTITASATGQTVDSTNTLSVNLAASGGELISGSAADMTALNTATYVGGEIIAYQNATLTGANAYNLAPMVRGAYSTTIGAHAVGSAVLRLDENIVKIPYTADRVGATIYLKLQSFNQYGGGTEDIATVGAISYVIQGTALSAPLPDVTNLRRTFIDNTAGINFDEVTDFRSPRYEIRSGTVWESANFQGTIAHPPFPTYGDGTYLIKAVAEPAPGLVVYSTTAASIVMTGTVLTDNVVASYNDSGLGWLGTITGSGVISGGNFQTTALNSVAYYTSPVIYDGLYNRKLRLDPTFTSGGQTGADFLAVVDVLAMADILGGALGTEGWLEIMVASDDAGDIYAAADIYDIPSIYDDTTATWVKYAPGYNFGRFMRVRVAIISYVSGVTAVATVLTTSLDVTARLDHLTNDAVGSGGVAITFRPDNYASDVAFLYGPNLAPLPLVVPVILNPNTGDYCKVTALTLSGCTVQAFDSTSTGVARTMNITIEGA